uniref:Uncharacterized protein n=1 Tax=Alexandrium andersonii TaxID=327968 RepID=A0A7S2DQK2_9DINO|mmetsp:Transcript_56935/g.128205  ORF Transcript_56935/g.128205 Transcript_56935/m.128205 type:complete len:218 (+) Transcript_56935:92-745(+)
MFTNPYQQQQSPQQQVIGAAVNDPRVQKAAVDAAKDTASDPRNQSAAWNAARNAAQNAAQQGATQARSGFNEVRLYVQETHCGIRAYCFCIALALLASSILGVFNIFAAAFKPFQYLWAVYNVIFAAVIIIIDGKPEWFTKCWDVQAKLFQRANFLATWTGRAILYFYVGSINLVLLPEAWGWKLVYIVIGASLCSIACLMMLQGCRCCQAPAAQGP